jgi:hypothetical protein
MPDELFNRTRPQPAPRGRGRSIFGMILLMLLIIAGLAGWLSYEGRLRFDTDFLGNKSAPRTVQPLATPLPDPATVGAALPPAIEAAASGFDNRLAALEQRLARLDLQAEAASGNAARAEGLLIAFAARRAIERGAPLGYLEEQLKLRFSDAQPNAVDLVIATARQPVTINRLAGELGALGPKLINMPEDESGWSQIRREISGLFVIRRDSGAASLPADRLEQAKLLLRTGQVDQALTVVEQLPGATAAYGWISDARRYASAVRALDLIETTAILEPRKLHDGRGQRVEQASPLAAEATY